ncbi:MAG: helix-turn-helix domain-containing protein, partial [Phycisphaerae bacterium]|nr:helix-turn-helix domain-containing protein [Phycisphaerae bacterium]
KLSAETGAALCKLVGYFAASEWWTSRDGTRERMACKQARLKQEEFPDHERDPGDAPFRPQLLLERDSVYSVAPTVTGQLDAVLMQIAVVMDNLDLCRLGVSLAGFCYRSTSQLGVPFINSVLNNLAARDVTDLQAENEFRLTVGLTEVSEDRRPRSVTDPTLPPPFVPEDVTAGSNRQGLFAPYVEDMTDQRDLILGCAFQRFDVMIPPAEWDASQYPELPRLKNKLQAASVKTTKSAGKTNLTEETRFWTEEAIAYLGLDRCGLARPDLSLQRYIKDGVLRPIKIGRRNAFTKAELDRVLEKGSQTRRRGRPRKQED